jgi:hypothetical protein
MPLEKYLLRAVEKIAGFELYPYQRKIALKIIKSIINFSMDTYTILWSRQIGKTEIGKLVIITLMLWLPTLASYPEILAKYPKLEKFKDGFRVGFIGPKEEQASIPFNRIKDDIELKGKYVAWFRKFGVQIVSKNSKLFSLSNGSFMKMHTAKKGSAKEGDTFDFLWFEEAQDLSSYAIYKVFLPMLADTHGSKVFVGTSDYKRCEFYNMIQSNKTYQPDFHSEVDCYQAIEEKPGYAAWLDKYVADLRPKGGKESAAYKMACELKWMFSGGQLMSYEAFQWCRANGVDGKPGFKRMEIDYSGNYEYLLSLDFAKHQDKTACGFWEIHDDHIRLLDLLDMKTIDHNEQDQIIAGWLKDKTVAYKNNKYNPYRWTMKGHVKGDSQGIGDVRLSNLKAEFRRHGLSHWLISGQGFTLPDKDKMYKTFNNSVPLEKNRPTKVLWYDAGVDDMEFEQFEREVLTCEVKKKGTKMTFAAPDESSDVDDSERQYDDYVDQMMVAVQDVYGRSKARMV